MKKLKENTKRIRSAIIGLEVAAMSGFAMPCFAAQDVAKPDFKNSFFSKIWDKLDSIYLDIAALATVIAAICLVIELVVNFLLPGGDSKTGIKRVRTILVAYGAIAGIAIILELVTNFVTA